MRATPLPSGRIDHVPPGGVRRFACDACLAALGPCASKRGWSPACSVWGPGACDSPRVQQYARHSNGMSRALRSAGSFGKTTGRTGRRASFIEASSGVRPAFFWLHA